MASKVRQIRMDDNFSNALDLWLEDLGFVYTQSNDPDKKRFDIKGYLQASMQGTMEKHSNGTVTITFKIF